MTSETYSTVQLYFDQQTGQTWYANGTETPQVATSQQWLVCYLSSLQNLRIRILGTAFNAGLIVAVYDHCCRGKTQNRLEVASPLLCYSTSELHSPTVAMYRMRQCSAPASLGGWHIVDDLTYPAYAMLVCRQAVSTTDDQLVSIFKTHPLYSSLLFLPTLEHTYAAKLLVEIIDPRWFVDVRNPYRLAKLRSYLGLTPYVVRDVLIGNTETSQALRCNYVIKSWRNEQLQRFEISAPGNFLWRVAEAAGGGNRGILRASQFFISYLTRVWFDKLQANTKPSFSLFDPPALFRSSELHAYVRHDALTATCR